MTTTPDNGNLQDMQWEVQRLLGQCLLQIQQCERLMKAIVAHHYLCGSVTALEVISTARVEDVATKTLGTLVGQLFGSYIVTDPDAEEVLADPGAVEVGIMRMRFHLSMTTEDYQRTQADLRDLVALRNGLVHHFIDQHDLQSAQGCRSALGALVEAHTHIGQHFEQLRGWVEQMDQTRRLVAEFVQSNAFREWVVNGIAPDGSIDWAASGIVRALREAVGELAADGWAPAVKAGCWIQAKYPEQVPSKYGCKSWRQVVHESRLFELRYREVDGQRVAYYRERSI